MTQDKFDIVVIGGGPAGSVAASYCAQSGYTVALVERYPFPRETLCGEFLSHEVIAILSDLGLKKEFLSLGPSPITRLTLCPERGLPLTAHLGFTAYGLKRGAFDNMLLENARSSGVLVIQPASAERIVRGTEGFEILCRSQGELRSIRSRWVIGAYGRRSPLDKQLLRSFAGAQTGLNGVKFHIPASTLQNMHSDEILLFAGSGMYCGLNHVDGGSATICFLERRTGNSRAPRERIRELTDANATFARVITPDALGAVDHASIYGAGNIYFGPRSVVENGMLMVGDAGRVIAPLAGDGIGMALQGAQLLGRIFEEERRRPADRTALEQSYRRGWSELFDTRVRSARLFQQIFLSDRLRRIGSAVLSIAPSLLQTALNMTRAGRDATK